MEPDSLSEPLSIDVAVNADVWNDVKQAADKDWIAAQLAPVLTLGDIRRGELSIALTDDVKMAVLNQTYREKDGPTNVLSFPSLGPLLGDIVLSYETIAREAEAKSVSLSNHLSHLLIHGFLHLQGYDHLTDTDAAEMEALEITALAQLGIDNPYEKQTIK